MKRKALQSLTKINAVQKGLDLVASPRPVDHTRPGLLYNAGVAKVGRGNCRSWYYSLRTLMWDSRTEKPGDYPQRIRQVILPSTAMTHRQSE